jgi:8-oxo-dGTP pyrophosphatase MutT (NUDIX family)
MRNEKIVVVGVFLIYFYIHILLNIHIINIKRRRTMAFIGAAKTKTTTTKTIITKTTTTLTTTTTINNNVKSMLNPNFGKRKYNNNNNNKLPEETMIPYHILDDIINNCSITINITNLNATMTDIQKCHWYYEDTYGRSIPFRTFAIRMFNHLPELRRYLPIKKFSQIFKNYRTYKKTLFSVGGILSSPDFEQILLVQSIHSGCWSFPKGKLEPTDESHVKCAIREVYEETSCDVTKLINLDDYIELKNTKLFWIPNVPINVKYRPKVNNEIKQAQWFTINELIDITQDPMRNKQFSIIKPFIELIYERYKLNKKTLNI